MTKSLHWHLSSNPSSSFSIDQPPIKHVLPSEMSCLKIKTLLKCLIVTSTLWCGTSVLKRDAPILVSVTMPNIWVSTHNHPNTYPDTGCRKGAQGLLLSQSGSKVVDYNPLPDCLRSGVTCCKQPGFLTKQDVGQGLYFRENVTPHTRLLALVMSWITP